MKVFGRILSSLFVVGTASAAALIPYRVLSTQAEPATPHKVSITVQVDAIGKRLPIATELAAVAKIFHQQHAGRSLIFVTFLLPGMREGEGAFATAHSRNGQAEAVRIMTFDIPAKYKKLVQ